MHYVYGFPLPPEGDTSRLPLPPPVLECIRGNHGYENVKVRWPPRSRFQYSGGGYLVMQHLLILLHKALRAKGVCQHVAVAFDESKESPIDEIMKPFLSKMCGVSGPVSVIDSQVQDDTMVSFALALYNTRSKQHAIGYKDDGKPAVSASPGGRLLFPALAAGGEGTAGGMAQFLVTLYNAFWDKDHKMHETACRMLH